VLVILKLTCLYKVLKKIDMRSLWKEKHFW